MLVLTKVCNCTHISHMISLSLIVPKNCKGKEVKDEQLCRTVHIINNICDADPPDK